MPSALLRRPLAAALLACLLPGAAQAAAVIVIDDDSEISVGAGIRTSFRSEEAEVFDAAGFSATEESDDFDVDNVRLYVNGQVTEDIFLTFNTDRGPDDDIEVLDAIVRFEFSDYLNFWGGRFLPPSDRSNLSGPFYINAWDFPAVQAYPFIIAGRDEGAAYWGQWEGGRVKWQVGAFEGPEPEDALEGDDSDDLLYAGRLTFNFLDPIPGYYTSSTFFGEADVLALGLVAQQQGDDAAYSVDLLAERYFDGIGTLTFEGAYYEYDGLGFDGTEQQALEGDGYFLLASYLFPEPLGWGRLQPNVRYQEGTFFDVDGERWDVGLNYIIDGHDAKLALVWFDADDLGGVSADGLILGVQLQI